MSKRAPRYGDVYKADGGGYWMVICPVYDEEDPVFGAAANYWQFPLTDDPQEGITAGEEVCDGLLVPGELIYATE